MKREGLAREIVSRIQGIRKDSGLEVTDRISVLLSDVPEWREALTENNYYICNETLADSLKIEPGLVEGTAVEVDGVQGWIKIAR